MLAWDEKTMTYKSVRKPAKKKMGRPPGKSKKAKSVSGRKQGESKAVVERQTQLAALVAMGVPRKKALVGAGYSPKSKGQLCAPRVREAVASMRERMRETEGYTLEDSVKFYRQMSGNKKVAASDRIRARGRIDDILGYNDAKKVEVSSETRELSMAVAILSDLREDPVELLKSLKSGVVAGEIEETTDA